MLFRNEVRFEIRNDSSQGRVEFILTSIGTKIEN